MTEGPWQPSAARPEPARRLLIVGATGVLRPAALMCAGAGWTVLAVARRTDPLDELAAASGGRAIPVPFDVFDPAAVEAALASGPLAGGADQAVFYIAGEHDETENAAVDLIGRAVTGNVVRILNSRWAPPGDLPLDNGRWPRPPNRLHLLLGTKADGRTWHTPEEISAVALSVLRTGKDRTLGELRRI